MVADVTGPSREVLFEYGFSKNKYVILVVYRRQDQASLPKWITVIQLLPPYESGGIGRIAESVATKVLQRPEGFRLRPFPTPGMALWLQDEQSDWADAAYQRSRNLLSEHSIELVRRRASEIESSEELRKCLRSWLTIACIDGLSADYLGHFLLGDVMARTKAGSGNGRGESVQRLGVAFSLDSNSPFVAESVRRAAGRVVKIASLENLDEVLRGAADRYRSFLRSG